MPQATDYIGCYPTNAPRRNCVGISIPLPVYRAMGEPRAVVFSEFDFSLHTSTLDTQREYKVTINATRAIFTVRLIYTNADMLIGNWTYEVGDLSLFLITKK